MRPIGTGEVIRRIIEKAVTSCLRSDIINTNGNLQLCTEIILGCQIAVHASVNMFEDEENYGILQIDASTAFHGLSRAAVII